ncbi:MAG TPA: M13 family metallopeptidase [Terriglobales bacterium]|nr:M13 family metallopeptidase [Terriglobales bacterium]
MRFARIFLLVLLCATFSLQLAAQSAADNPQMPTLNRFDPNQVDKSVDPCGDFYKFACGKWQAANPIPPDQASWSVASPLRLWNEMVLRETMEKAAPSNKTRSAAEQKVGDYYAACMDEAGIEKAGAQAIEPELARINALKSKSDIAGELAHLHQSMPGAWQGDDNQTNAPLLGFSGGQDLDDASMVVVQIDQGGLGLPSRDFYLKDDDRSKQVRTKYQEHVRKMFVLAGESDAQAAADAATVMVVETQLAQGQMDNVRRRDPKNLNNRMNLAQMKALTPSFNWKAYLALVKPPATHHYIVSSPEYFRGLETALKEHPLDHWKAYLRWHLLRASAAYLSKGFVEESFDFNGRTLQGTKEMLPRWRRCVRAADRDLGEALGQAYVERAFPPTSKERMVNLVHAVEKALAQDIDSLDWMTPETKKQAAVKLAAIEDKIGYPKTWRNYTSVRITPASYLGNVHQTTAFEFKRVLNKVGKPVDRGEWGMTPPTINAYYDAQLNTINFPAGILQAPFFDAAQDESVNYGAIGMVIGHEITHGFDDQGRKFDAHGNLKDWWTAQDGTEYEKRGKCISDEYTQSVPEAGPDVKQNGLLTQGEDTADNGGLRIAFMALSNTLKDDGKSVDAPGPDGLTPRQRFFLGYANAWCGNLRPEIMRTQVVTNPHSLPKYRVNNVVSNMPEFQQAFSCKKGQAMVRANACRVW